MSERERIRKLELEVARLRGENEGLLSRINGIAPSGSCFPTACPVYLSPLAQRLIEQSKQSGVTWA